MCVLSIKVPSLETYLMILGEVECKEERKKRESIRKRETETERDRERERKRERQVGRGKAKKKEVGRKKRE